MCGHDTVGAAGVRLQTLAQATAVNPPPQVEKSWLLLAAGSGPRLRVLGQAREAQLKNPGNQAGSVPCCL